MAYQNLTSGFFLIFLGYGVSWIAHQQQFHMWQGKWATTCLHAPGNGPPYHLYHICLELLPTPNTNKIFPELLVITSCYPCRNNYDNPCICSTQMCTWVICHFRALNNIRTISWDRAFATFSDPWGSCESCWKNGEPIPSECIPCTKECARRLMQVSNPHSKSWSSYYYCLFQMRKPKLTRV